MADLLWDDVRWCFDDEAGQLPDVWVTGVSVADWQAVLDLAAAQGWAFQYFEGSTVLPLPSAAAVFARPADAELAQLQVWPSPDVLAIFRFCATDEIDFDVDTREIQGQERLDVFCGFLTTIGRGLGKPVLMYDEGSQSNPLLGYDPEVDRVVAMAEQPDW